MTDLADKPALDRLLNGQWPGDMPIRLRNEYGFGCDGCPFASLHPDENPQEICHDPSEAYYSCSLMNLEKVWGEGPKCQYEDWQKRAREELIRPDNYE